MTRARYTYWKVVSEPNSELRGFYDHGAPLFQTNGYRFVSADDAKTALDIATYAWLMKRKSQAPLRLRIVKVRVNGGDE